MQGKKDLEAVESASSDDEDSETEFLNRVHASEGCDGR